MKRLIILTTLIIILFSSCRTEEDIENINKYIPKYIIIKIDGCEYLRNDYEHATFLTHKGNCSNTIHNN